MGASTSTIVMMDIWCPAQFGASYWPSTMFQTLQCQKKPFPKKNPSPKKSTPTVFFSFSVHVFPSVFRTLVQSPGRSQGLRPGRPRTGRRRSGGPGGGKVHLETAKVAAVTRLAWKKKRGLRRRGWYGGWEIVGVFDMESRGFKRVLIICLIVLGRWSFI